MNTMQSPAGRQSGFTLVELLVVLGVLGVLASLLFPAIARVKAKARMTQCQSNLKQHGVAMHNFLATQNAYPLAVDITATNLADPENNRSFQYALKINGLGPWPNPPNDKSSIWNCPAALVPKLPPSAGLYRFPSAHYAYNANGLGTRDTGVTGLGGNEWMGAAFYRSPVLESQVINPSRMIAFGDGIGGWNGRYRDSISFLLRSSRVEDFFGSTQRVIERHRKLANIVFCDGHVEALSLDYLFTDSSDDALRIWNRDNEPHRERLK